MAKSKAMSRKDSNKTQEIGDFDRFYEILPKSLDGKDANLSWKYNDALTGFAREVPLGPVPHPQGRPYERGTGFPIDFSPPVMVFPKRPKNWEPSQALPLGDVESAGGSRVWMISERARQLFLEFDPEAFVFHPLEVQFGTDFETYSGPPYWLCDVIRYLDAFDLDKTKYKVETYPVVGDIVFTDLFSTTYLKRSVVEGSHIFRPMQTSHEIFCSHAMASAMKARGIVVEILKKAAVTCGA